MFTQLPENWPRVSEQLMQHAVGQARAAVQDEAAAVRYLAAYYQSEGNYAGSTFGDLHPNDPCSFSGSDLLAVTMLSVDIPQVAVRRLLGPGRISEYLSEMLADEDLSSDLNLLVAGQSTLEKMSEFYEAVKGALAPVGVAASDRWVTASKICARKRPDLFPVRDEVVTSYLGTRARRSYAVDWQVFCGLLEDDSLMSGLRNAVDLAAKEDGVSLGGDRTLRHLDVVLWMHASRREAA